MLCPLPACHCYPGLRYYQPLPAHYYTFLTPLRYRTTAARYGDAFTAYALLCQAGAALPHLSPPYLAPPLRYLILAIVARRGRGTALTFRLASCSSTVLPARHTPSLPDTAWLPSTLAGGS